MSLSDKDIKPLLERARIKDRPLNLDDISAFIDSEKHQVEEVLKKLEEAGVEVKESSENGGKKLSVSKNSLQLYLEEIGQFDLLTAEEEIELSRQIHQARDKIVEICRAHGVDPDNCQKILKYPDKELLHQLFKKRGVKGNQLAGIMRRINRYREQYRKAHTDMVQANLKLVISIAKKYQYCGLSFDDLINEGNLGLMRAVDRYDYKKGFRFSTYAAWWIRQAILRAISNKSRTIRLPVYMIALVRRWKYKKQELQQQLGREPHMMEVADALDIDYEKATHIMRHSMAPTSLEASVGEDEDSELKNLIEADTTKGVERWFDERRMQEKLWKAIEQELDDKEREVFIYRYGLKNQDELTLKEVGEKLNLTRERIRQIQEEALKKIRNSKHSEDLKSFLRSLTS